MVPTAFYYRAFELEVLAMSRNKHQTTRPGLPNPPVRATCIDGPRPCPFISCRHYMFPVEPADWPISEPSCSLDVVDAIDKGAERPTLTVLGRWFGLSLERMRQIEMQALDRAKAQVEILDAELVPNFSTSPAAVTTESRLIDVLVKRGDWVRAAELSSTLSITRASVVRIVRRIRDRGDTRIKSRRKKGGGYRWVA